MSLTELDHKKWQRVTDNYTTDYDESYTEVDSPTEGNLTYYMDNPEKYSKKKIDSETWLPKETREEIKDKMSDFLIETFGSVKRRVTIRHHYYYQYRYERGKLGGRIYRTEAFRKRKRVMQ